jgi:hypothetical protein
MPIAEAEKARMRAIKVNAEQGILVNAEVVEKGQVIQLDPNRSRPAWNCDYCSHLGVCRNYPTGDTPYVADVL